MISVSTITTCGSYEARLVIYHCVHTPNMQLLHSVNDQDQFSQTGFDDDVDFITLLFEKSLNAFLRETILTFILRLLTLKTNYEHQRNTDMYHCLLILNSLTVRHNAHSIHTNFW